MPNQIPYELTKGPYYWSHYLGETSLYYGLLLQISAQGNNKNTGKKCEICSMLRMETSERRR